MKTFNARGVVLKEYEAGESDKRLVLLCKEHGRFTVYAKGARKPKSKYLAAAQLFTYSDFVIADGRRFLSLTQADVIKSFYGIRSGYDRLAAAHLFAEVCEKTLLENTPCDELLLLLLKSLNRLSGEDGFTPEHTAAVFMLRFYLYYGIAPQTDCCGSPLEYFCGDGLACKGCAANRDSLPVSPGTAAAIKYILESGPSGAFSFRADPGILNQLGKAWRLYWKNHFDYKLQSERTDNGNQNLHQK